MAAPVDDSLHVCLLFEFPTMSGGEQSMLALIDAARRHGVRVSALAPGGALADALRQSGAAVRELALRDTDAVREALGDWHPDVVHANSLSASVMLGRWRSRCDSPVSDPARLTGHVRDIMKLSRARADALATLDRLVAVSRAAADALVEQGVPRERITVVTNGIDAEGVWNPDHVPPGRFRADLGVPDDAPLIITVGQICLRKDQATFLAGTLPLLDEFTDLQLAVVGERWSDKDESRAFEQALHDAVPPRHRDRVHITGWRDDMPAVLRDATLVVSTARQEPFGRVLLEASAMARPLIATDVGGTREIIEPDVTGRLIAPGDVAAVTDACRSWLRDASAATESGRHARDRMREHFPVRRMVDGVLAVWRDE